MAAEPTHHIAHKTLGQAFISLTDANIANLASDDSEVRGRAQRHVAATAGYTYTPRESRAGADPSDYLVDFDDLTLHDIRPPVDEEPPIPMGPGGEPLDCDDCPMCDRGDHHLCRSRQGCPQAIGW